MIDVNVTQIIQKVKEDLESAMENKQFSKITSENPIKFSNGFGDFEFDGGFLYFTPLKPVKKVKIQMELKNNL